MKKSPRLKAKRTQTADSREDVTVQKKQTKKNTIFLFITTPPQPSTTTTYNVC